MTRQRQNDLVIDNARLVTPEAEVQGHVLVRDGMIAEIGEGASGVAGAVDLGGDYLLPGLIELHTDNLEKHIAPRPGVRWPTGAAVLAHDAQIAAAGITTVFDALAVGESRDDFLRSEMLLDAAKAIHEAGENGLFRAEHLLHMRCEVAHPGVVETFELFLDDPLVRLVSLMDHTPGQRQFASIEKFKEYYQGRFGYSDRELEQLQNRRLAQQREFSDLHRRRIVELCARRNLPTASHDDTTVEHVEESAGLGMTIAEFPTSVVAASTAHGKGMAVVMGAPNIVRGGSHSGNVSASELAGLDLLDVLSSDYVPASLLLSAFLLHQELGVSLPAATAKISANPARVLGLNDRGEIATGKRADLVWVSLHKSLPIVRQVWRGGRRIV